MLTTKIADNPLPFYENLYQLYNDSFPVEERREWGEMELILKIDKRFNRLVFTIENEFSGFLTYWEFGSFVYVEHFAVPDSKRGQGIGTQFMKSFIIKQQSPIVLEVELPEHMKAIRRIAFYEKLGFKTITKNYLQPPYDGKSDFLALAILSNDENYATKDFEQIKETLYKEVYKADIQHF